MIERGNGLDCGVGWYKTPERERFGKFTTFLYRDKAPVIIARARFQPQEATLAALMADPAKRVVMKEGLSYGPDVASIMVGAKAKVQTVTTEQTTLARMVALDRADFMLSPQEEAQTLLGNVQSGERLKVLQFPDLRQGATRHILCSKKVSDETIDKLNAALVKPTEQPVIRTRSTSYTQTRP